MSTADLDYSLVLEGCVEFWQFEYFFKKLDLALPQLEPSLIYTWHDVLGVLFVQYDWVFVVEDLVTDAGNYRELQQCYFPQFTYRSIFFGLTDLLLLLHKKN